MTLATGAITASQLTRRFGDLVAVDRLDLDIPTGGVVGFVGPNGSGKSTTIRMLLGLIRPTSGTATVLGHPITEPVRYASRVGALIESPAFVPGISARGNLRSMASLRGTPARRVDEVLDVVGLTDRADTKVREYSLGIKQRLGIAIALLPDPAVLVLDEPTNGLDPAGIVEIRAPIRALGDQGRTVLVSSRLRGDRARGLLGHPHATGHHRVARRSEGHPSRPDRQVGRAVPPNDTTHLSRLWRRPPTTPSVVAQVGRWPCLPPHDATTGPGISHRPPTIPDAIRSWRRPPTTP